MGESCEKILIQESLETFKFGASVKKNEAQACDAAVVGKRFTEQRCVRQAQVGEIQRGQRVIAVADALQQLRREDRVI